MIPSRTINTNKSETVDAGAYVLVVCLNKVARLSSSCVWCLLEGVLRFCFEMSVCC